MMLIKYLSHITILKTRMGLVQTCLDFYFLVTTTTTTTTTTTEKTDPEVCKLLTCTRKAELCPVKCDAEVRVASPESLQAFL